MRYVYDFDIGSLLFFSLTIFFYLYQKRIRNLKDSIFTAMLVFSMIAIAFDFAAAAMEYHALSYPVWILYAVNMLFIFGMQTCLPLFFFYAVASAEKFNGFSGIRRIACSLPYAITMILLFISPFTDIGVCFIDDAHIYHHGLTHIALYINVGLYVLGGIAVLYINKGCCDRLQRSVIMLFAGILFVSSVVQALFPRYLLTASATALGLTSIFHALQSPIDQIDPLTGAFSRKLLPSLLKDYSERGRMYTLVLFSLRSYDEFTTLYGNDAGNALIKAYSERLMEAFPKEITVYMDACEFTVVYDGFLSKHDALAIQARSPKTIQVGEYGAVSVDTRLGALCQEHGDDCDYMLTVADCMLGEMRVKENKGILYADDGYKNKCAMKLRLEATLGESLQENRLALDLSAIYNSDAGIALYEAKLCVDEDMAKFVSYKQLMQSVCHGGYALDYYRSLLKALSVERENFKADDRICLPLLVPAFLKENALDEMLSLVAATGFEPERILFCVEESEIASFKAALSGNIKKFSDNGFSFMLDAFAEGYTDMSFVISLPFSYARLHESLLSGAKSSGDGAKLLRGLIGILDDVNITPVCRGINDKSFSPTRI